MKLQSTEDRPEYQNSQSGFIDKYGNRVSHDGSNDQANGPS